MMKSICTGFLCLLLFTACRHGDKAIVNTSFADSLISHYSPSVSARTCDSNILFWQKRIDSFPDNFLNGPEVAAGLSSRFRLYGNIHDLLKADSLYRESNRANQENEPGIFRTLASFDMLRHRFHEADTFLQKSIKIEGRSFPNIFLDFDVSFELGEEGKAKTLLQSLQSGNQYGYLFRRSKFEHYSGSLDSAIGCMLRAAENTGNSNYLKQIAYSNAADLYMHKGDLEKAYQLYVQSILIDAADFHSLMGIGWIALVHDKNDSLAEKIFHFVETHSYAPDALLKLEQVAEGKNDTAMERKYALAFEARVTDSAYGKMYSKYLIDLYTGILDEPAKAVELAQLEISNRATPQVYAWYAWSLFSDHQPDKAYAAFKQGVSGKPLEGPELYYMGKMMQGLQKGYNAQQFFKAAYKNRYDLSPSHAEDLDKNLE